MAVLTIWVTRWEPRSAVEVTERGWKLMGRHRTMRPYPGDRLASYATAPAKMGKTYGVYRVNGPPSNPSAGAESRAIKIIVSFRLWLLIETIGVYHD